MTLKLATLGYVKHAGRTLMIHRVKKPDDIHQDKWNGLGGKFNPGESPEQCVIRELKEESGLTISNPKLKGFLTFPNFNGHDDWYVFVFVATEFTGELIVSAEGDLRWIDDAELMNLNLWGGDRIFLPWLDQDKFFSAVFTYQYGKLTSHSVNFY